MGVGVGGGGPQLWQRRKEMSCLFKASTEEHLTSLFIYLVYIIIFLGGAVLTHCSVSRWKWLETEAMHFDQGLLL